MFQATSEANLMAEFAHTASTALTTPDEIDELNDSELEIVSGGKPGQNSLIGIIIDATKSDEDKFEDCLEEKADDNYAFDCYFPPKN